MIKVVITDDHKILRDGLKALLSSNERIDVVGECTDGSEVLPFLEKTEADVVLMDIKMSKINGIEATKQVLDKYPEIKVLALSMYNEEIYITKMLEAGASGYILKNTGEDELIKAIETVFNGEIFFSDDVTEVMMAKYMKKSTMIKTEEKTRFVEELTRREREVLKLIVEEMTNNEIAEKLFISPRTVDTHRRNLLQKLEVKNTAGLVKMAIRHGLID